MTRLQQLVYSLKITETCRQGNGLTVTWYIALRYYKKPKSPGVNLRTLLVSVPLATSVLMSLARGAGQIESSFAGYQSEVGPSQQSSKAQKLGAPHRLIQPSDHPIPEMLTRTSPQVSLEGAGPWRVRYTGTLSLQLLHTEIRICTHDEMHCLQVSLRKLINR